MLHPASAKRNFSYALGRGCSCTVVTVLASQSKGCGVKSCFSSISEFLSLCNATLKQVTHGCFPKPCSNSIIEGSARIFIFYNLDALNQTKFQLAVLGPSCHLKPKRKNIWMVLGSNPGRPPSGQSIHSMVSRAPIEGATLLIIIGLSRICKKNA